MKRKIVLKLFIANYQIFQR